MKLIGRAMEPEYGNTLVLVDGAGGSLAVNNSDFGGDWIERADGECLCFDYKVNLKKLNTSTGVSAPLIQIYTGRDLRTLNDYATFARAVFIGNPDNPEVKNLEWYKFCLPIGECVGGKLPSNSFGTWRVYRGDVEVDEQNACTIWNDIIHHVRGVILPTDYHSTPSELIFFDNFCWKCLGTIRGVKYWDKECDGVMSPYDSLMAGWEIIATGEDGSTYSAFTDVYGTYSITVPGEPGGSLFRISERMQEGWVQCSPLPPDDTVRVGLGGKATVNVGNAPVLHPDCLSIEAMDIACRTDPRSDTQSVDVFATVTPGLLCDGDSATVTVESIQSSWGPISVEPVTTDIGTISSNLIWTLSAEGPITDTSLKMIVSICCKGDKPENNGECCLDTITISLPTRDIDPGIDASGPLHFCSGESVVLSAKQEGVEYLWSTGERSRSITVEKPGTYSLVLIHADGCRFRGDSVTVRVDDYPEAAIEGDTVLCRGGQIRLQASGGVRYEWSPSDGLACNGCPSPFAFPDTTTTYRVIAYSEAGCPDTAYHTVHVRSAPDVKLRLDGNLTFCEGDSVRITPNVSGDLYRWSNGAGTESIVVREGGVYFVQVFLEGGCPVYSDTIEVEVSAKPSAEILGGERICFGDSLSLSAMGGTDVKWTPTSSLSCTTCREPVVFPDSTTTYRLIVRNGADCADTAYHTVTVGRPPQVAIHADGPVVLCPGESVLLTGGTDVEDASFLWSNGSTATSIRITEAGDYTLFVVDSNGCTAISEPITVRRLPSPEASIAGDSIICIGGSTQLKAGGGERYEWQPETSLSCTDCPNPVASPLQPTTYSVTVFNAAGCSDTASITVVPTDMPFEIEVYVPRGLSSLRGRQVLVPVRVRNNEALALLGPSKITLGLEFSGANLYWTGEIEQVGTMSASMTAIREPAGTDRFEVTLHGTVVPETDTLLLVGLRMLIGEVIESELYLDVDLEDTTECFVLRTYPGSIRNDSICGLEYRLMEFTGLERNALEPIAASHGGHAAIEFTTALDGRVLMEITDVEGRAVVRPIDSHLDAGRHRLELDVSGFAAGHYFCRLTLGDWTSTRRLLIVE